MHDSKLLMTNDEGKKQRDLAPNKILSTNKNHGLFTYTISVSNVCIIYITNKLVLFNVIHLPCHCPIYKSLHIQFVAQYLLFTAPKCFGHRTCPSAGSYKIHRLSHILHMLQVAISRGRNMYVGAVNNKY